MTLSVGVILTCIFAGLAAMVGIGVQALRHGHRPQWRWLMLPSGVIMSFALIPAVVGFAEGVWRLTDWRVVTFASVGFGGLLFQALGWRAVLRPRLRLGQCPTCGYDAGSFSPCPECGRSREPLDD